MTPTTAAPPTGAITDELCTSLREAFDASATCRMAQNAVAQNPADDVALDRTVVTSVDHSFSHLLDDWKVTSQKKSGRCWMFAGLNLLRVPAMQQMNLKEFEFSQNYTFFWDKFERANYFLEAIIGTADRPVDDRTVAYLLTQPIGDGGQWNMFVNIIDKHGLVPKSAMPETESSSNSPRMNRNLEYQLRRGAMQLRDAIAGGASLEEVSACKHEILAAIHRILCIHLGSPPSVVDWQWNDKDKEFHRDGTSTPQEFAARYLQTPLDEYVCLVHDPRCSSPYGRTFTVDFLGNVVGGAIVKYLNVEIDLMKEVTRRTIEDGEPVWMGCDVAPHMRRDLGIWDAKLFDWASLYDTPFDLSKSERLCYHQTQMTHAMLFTGVDVVDGQTRRWRVENSWGDENGVKGFYLMNDSWFDQYMFEIAAKKKYLPPELLAAHEEQPIVLPAWDPMGSLAG